MEPMENDKFLSALATARNTWKMQNPDVNFFLRKRYLVSLWSCVGYSMLYILRSNLSIAIVEMTSKKNLTLANGTVVEEAAHYDWEPAQKGFVISLFYYGFYFSPLGSILTVKYGGVKVFGFGIAGTAILSALSPYLLRLHFIYFATARVFEGMFEVMSAVAFLNIFIYWAPPNERSRLVLLGFLGVFVGIFCNYSLCGLIAYYFGVDAVFTVTGGIALAWSIIGLLFISNSPLTDRLITTTEKNYLRTLISFSYDKKLSYPWKAILTSKPAWALFNEYFSLAWSFSFLGACLPLYVKDVFDVDIKTIGYISSIPILADIVGIIIGASVADYIRSNKILRIATLHRVYVTLGQLSCIIFFILVGVWADFMESIICFSLMRVFVGVGEVSYQVICMDMFGEYTALVRSIALIFANTGLLLNPTVLGYIVSDHSRSSWNQYFLFVSFFNIFSLITFYKYGSGEFQEWAATKPDEDLKKDDGNSEQ